MNSKVSRKTNDRFLEDIREGLKQSVEYFKSENRQERERWTCHEFVRNLGRRAWAKSFVSPQQDPPDVIYRDARFEVKEILDPGRKRHDEYRKLLDEALEATESSQVMKQYSPKDITPQQVGNLVLGRVNKLRRKYEPKLQRTLDLLFYVNLMDTYFANGPMPDGSLFAGCGWRSVSVVMGWHSFVFHAEKEAPRIIRDAIGTWRLRTGKNG